MTVLDSYLILNMLTYKTSDLSTSCNFDKCVYGEELES